MIVPQDPRRVDGLLLLVGVTRVPAHGVGLAAAHLMGLLREEVGVSLLLHAVLVHPHHRLLLVLLRRYHSRLVLELLLLHSGLLLLLAVVSIGMGGSSSSELLLLLVLVLDEVFTVPDGLLALLLNRAARLPHALLRAVALAVAALAVTL